MRKLLTSFLGLTIIATSGSSLAACGTPNGKMVPFYIYDGPNDSIQHNPTANNVSGGIFDGYSNTDDYQFQANTAATNYRNQVSLSANTVIPLLTGINLTPENTKSIDGAKWSAEQLQQSLTSQKDNLNKDQKWTNFFQDFSSQFDTYFTQMAVIKSQNKQIIDKFDGKLIDKVASVDKTTDKNLIDTGTHQLKSSLYALAPINNALTYLDANYSLEKYNNKDFQDQNAAYALLSVGDVNVTFEFIGLKQYWDLNVTVKNVAARFQYGVFIDPNNSGNTKNYIHQWFFTGYDFYDSNNFSAYNGTGNFANNKTDSNYQKGALAIGYYNSDTTKKNNTNYLYSDDPKSKNGAFDPQAMPGANKEISFTWLDWKINPNITENNL